MFLNMQSLVVYWNKGCYLTSALSGSGNQTRIPVFESLQTLGKIVLKMSVDEGLG